ncbi:hypothetical protein [Spirosoma oryzicola]|uniref:hypothetical protein n=1 Tax=Spirosoma oryzicola TaxID=2898794 RepID=UPI001E4C2209|nr:hypothetical protein [Spirosoma oryzicola]UHG94961.1 hypothetical protein LQ777_30475 [Spirosoma oryzicola]
MNKLQVRRAQLDKRIFFLFLVIDGSVIELKTWFLGIKMNGFIHTLDLKPTVVCLHAKELLK